MADEAVIIELGPLGGNPVRRTVADGATISKGTLCYLADPNTAAATLPTVSKAAFAGIAAADKVANDGATTLSLYTEGVFDLKVSKATVTAGELVEISGANTIRRSDALGFISGAVIGKAEETATDGEVIRVRLIGY